MTLQNHAALFEEESLHIDDSRPDAQHLQQFLQTNPDQGSSTDESEFDLSIGRQSQAASRAGTDRYDMASVRFVQPIGNRPVGGANEADSQSVTSRSSKNTLPTKISISETAFDVCV